MWADSATGIPQFCHLYAAVHSTCGNVAHVLSSEAPHCLKAVVKWPTLQTTMLDTITIFPINLLVVRSWSSLDIRLNYYLFTVPTCDVEKSAQDSSWVTTSQLMHSALCFMRYCIVKLTLIPEWTVYTEVQFPKWTTNEDVHCRTKCREYLIMKQIFLSPISPRTSLIFEILNLLHQPDIYIFYKQDRLLNSMHKYTTVCSLATRAATRTQSVSKPIVTW